MKEENENSFVVLRLWMITKLHLSGKDLTCYALIYGFCLKTGCYKGSLSYLAKWLGTNNTHAARTLKGLVKRGLLLKSVHIENNVKLCNYFYNQESVEGYDQNGHTMTKMVTGYDQNGQGGMTKMDTHNIYNNIVDNKKEIIKEKAAAKSRYEEMIKGKRFYRLNYSKILTPIPDDAPPRPYPDYGWNMDEHRWVAVQ
jgi:hypothetical protein